jgi:HAD superfamily hydrolase (TIGR01509 family)
MFGFGKTEAIIFDLDGVISDSETIYLKSLNNVIEKFNIKVSRNEWFGKLLGTGSVNIMSTVFGENNIRPKEGLDHWLDKWKNEFMKRVKKGDVKTIKGFLKFNKEINKLKIKKAIATQAQRKNAFTVLKSFGVEKEFIMVASEDVIHRKPDPEIYLTAARRLNVNPKNCIVFEDSPVGLRAAKRAGMKSVALTTTAKRSVLKKEKPDLIFKDFTEIDASNLK